jgi:hypothetical protein
VLSIGVLSDNRTIYEEGIEYFKNGAGNGQIQNAIWKIYTVDGQALGQGQEAGRDQGHAMLDFALLGAIAQMAYNQGDDLFGYLDNIILAGFVALSLWVIASHFAFADFIAGLNMLRNTTLAMMFLTRHILTAMSPKLLSVTVVEATFARSGSFSITTTEF